MTHSFDLCHNPHFISARERDDTKKVMSKVTFPSVVCTFKSPPKKVLRKEKKKEDLSFCLPPLIQPV